jgi:hypothetical protein
MLVQRKRFTEAFRRQAVPGEIPPSTAENAERRTAALSPHAQRKEYTGATAFVASPHFVRWTTSMNRDFIRPEPAFGVDYGTYY